MCQFLRIVKLEYMHQNQSQVFGKYPREVLKTKADFEEFEIRETQERFRYFADGRVEKIED